MLLKPGVVGVAEKGLKEVFCLPDFILGMNPDSPTVFLVLHLIVDALHVKKVAERQSSRFARNVPNQPHIILSGRKLSRSALLRNSIPMVFVIDSTVQGLTLSAH